MKYFSETLQNFCQHVSHLKQIIIFFNTINIIWIYWIIYPIMNSFFIVIITMIMLRTLFKRFLKLSNKLKYNTSQLHQTYSLLKLTYIFTTRQFHDFWIILSTTSSNYRWCIPLEYDENLDIENSSFLITYKAPQIRKQTFHTSTQKRFLQGLCMPHTTKEIHANHFSPHENHHLLRWSYNECSPMFKILILAIFLNFF